MVVAFYVIMGFLLALFAAALVLWILYAVKTGLQNDAKGGRSRIGAGAYSEGESVSSADAGSKSQEPSKEKKPQGP